MKVCFIRLSISSHILSFIVFFVCLCFAKEGHAFNQRNNPTNNTIEEHLCDSASHELKQDISLLPDVTYVVSKGEYCIVENVKVLTIRGLDASNPSVIQCIGHSDDIISRGFAFQNATDVTFENVIFKDCGTILPPSLLDPFNNSNSTFHFGPGQASVLFCSHCTNFNLHNVTITNYTGYALVSINSLGETRIENTTVSNNDKLHTVEICHIPYRNHVCKGSGMLFMFIQPEFAVNSTATSTVTVENSTFFNNTAGHSKVDQVPSSECVDNAFDRLNSAFSYSFVLPLVGAVTVVHDNHRNVSMNFVSSVFFDNHGECFGAVLVMLLSRSDKNRVTLSECVFQENTPSLDFQSSEKGRNYFGRDITLYLKFHGDFQDENCLTIEDSIFNGAEDYRKSPQVSLLHFTGSNGSCTVNVSRVISTYSKFLFAFAIDKSNDRFNIEIHSINVSGRTSQQALAQDNGLLTFVRPTSVLISGTDEDPSLFQDLIGPAILGRQTDILLRGNVTFRNIMAANWAGGAAISLKTASHLWILEPLHAEFCNLTSLYGGAIHAWETEIAFCVIQFTNMENQYYDASNFSEIDVTLRFTNNSARFAGNSVYLDPLWNCGLQLSPFVDIPTSNISIVYDTIFDFDKDFDNGLFALSSSPEKICQCGENGSINASDLNCSQDPLSLKAIMTYPGKSFPLSVVPVNNKTQPVYSTVYLALSSINSDSEFDWSIKYGEYVTQMYGKACSQLNLIILSNQTARDGLLSLTPADIPQSLTFRISLQECPVGFQNSADEGCVCSPILKNNNVNCNISNKTFERPLHSWIGIVLNCNKTDCESNDTDETVIIGYTNHCPTRYCKKEISEFHITELYAICRFNRSGVMCGQCSDNLSVVVGGPQCFPCSNLWLLTIPLYGLAGIILVLLLLSLRISMSTGIINGLIFYANLFNVNSFTFFDYHGVRWFKVFIGLLNLETGFPICLYDGMNNLVRSHLSYIFPVYLWALGLALVIIAKYSSRVAKLIARTAVPTLATLFHLTFFKLMRYVVDGLTFSRLTTENQTSFENKTVSVWYYDGNVRYLKDGHATLFIIVLITLVFFIIPYCTILTGVKFFTRFRIINRFQPIIDAICAPYKDKWRFWHGVRLWVIIIIYITFASTRNNVYTFIYIQALIMMGLTFAQLAVMPYKNIAVNILDLFFLADATLLTVSALYFFSGDSSNPEGYPIAYIAGIFTGAVFIVFWFIIAYHVWVVIEYKFPNAIRRRRNEYSKLLTSRIQNDRDTTRSSRSTVTTTHTEVQQLSVPTKQRFDQFRDSILEDYSDD